jgi:phage gp46-like protein
MSGNTDAVLTIDPTTGLYDFSIDENGDILTDDFFDTSLLYSLLGERRASSSEMVEPQLRRGWIGNEGKDFENGSKIWLFSQARITRSNLNRIEDEAIKALQWLVDDGYAVSVENVSASINNGAVILDVTIRRSRSIVERRLYELWNNTGIR